MTRVARKRMHKSIRDNSRKARTRARTKDLDQIQLDMAKGHRPSEDVDLPGMGKHYCIECARHFVSEEALTGHVKSKIHRRRLKELRVPAYTQKEAEAAAGLKTDATRTQLPA